MSGRAYVVILFFWAVLTIITPMLIRLSESAKPTLNFNGERMEGAKAPGIPRLLPRRALVIVDTAPPLALALAPAPPAPPVPAPPSPPPPPPSPAPSPMTEPRDEIKKLMEQRHWASN